MSLHDEIEAKSRVKGFFSIFNRSERQSATAALPLSSAPIYQPGGNSGDRLIGFKEQAEPKAQKLIEHSTLGNDEFDLDSLVGAAKPL